MIQQYTSAVHSVDTCEDQRFTCKWHFVTRSKWNDNFTPKNTTGLFSSFSRPLFLCNSPSLSLTCALSHLIHFDVHSIFPFNCHIPSQWQLTRQVSGLVALTFLFSFSPSFLSISAPFAKHGQSKNTSELMHSVKWKRNDLFLRFLSNLQVKMLCTTLCAVSEWKIIAIFRQIKCTVSLSLALFLCLFSSRVIYKLQRDKRY